MKIFFGSDHAGFELKGKLVPFVKSLGYEVEDKGPFSYDPNDDYTDYTIPVARAVHDDPGDNKGVMVCGTGEGEAMTANRFVGVRAAVYYGGPLEIIKLSKEHNDANILALGARFLNETEAKEALELWLRTPFTKAERHIRRIAEIDSLTR